MWGVHMAVLEATPPTVDYLTPTILTAGTVLVAALGVLGAVYRRKQDRADKLIDVEAAKQLSEKEEGTEVERARAEATKYYGLYTAFRDLFYTVWDALKHAVRLIQREHPDMELPPDVTGALQVTPPDQPKR